MKNINHINVLTIFQFHYLESKTPTDEIKTLQDVFRKKKQSCIYTPYSKLNALISRRPGYPNNAISLYWKSSLVLFESTKNSYV